MYVIFYKCCTNQIHNVFSLCTQSVIYLLFTIALELLPAQKLNFKMVEGWWRSFQLFHRGFSDGSLDPLLRSSHSYASDENEDIDVQAERYRVVSGSAHSSIIYLRNLRKVIIIIIFLYYIFFSSVSF